MTKLEVFDAPARCSGGACGAGAEPAAESLTSDLQWLSDWGVEVTRYSLARQPGAFAANPEVAALLSQQGSDSLPAIVVEGVLRSSGRYPTRIELGVWALRTGASVGSAAPAKALPKAPCSGPSCCG